MWLPIERPSFSVAGLTTEFREVSLGPLVESALLRDRTCGALNYICDFLRVRDVDYVARACDLDRVALGPLGIPTFQVRADGPITSRHYHPARSGSPGSGGDRC